MVNCSGGTGGIFSISGGKIILRNFYLIEGKYMVNCSGGTGGIFSISGGKIILRNFYLIEGRIYGN